MSFNENVTDIMCTDKKELLPPLWISAIKILIAVFIITGKLLMLYEFFKLLLWFKNILSTVYISFFLRARF